MGKGTDMAREAGGALHAQAIDDFKDQLLIALLRRLGPKVDIPVSEVDATGGYTVKLSVEGGSFHFTVEQKQ